MISRHHYVDYWRNVWQKATPEQCARVGGVFGMSTGPYVCEGMDGNLWAEKGHEFIVKTRTYAARSGKAVQFVMGSLRIDTAGIRPPSLIGDAGERPGWNPDWLIRLPDEQVWEDLRRWFEAGGPQGITFNDNWLSIDWRGRMLKHFLGTGYLPAYYCTRVARDRLRIHRFLADVRIPEYRAWCLEHIVACRKRYGFDAIFVPTKMGWHQQPQIARPWPTEPYPGADKRWAIGGPLSDAPYPSGEYAAAMADWIKELDKEGIYPVVDDAPSQDGVEWSWMDGITRSRALGHGRVLKWKPPPLESWERL